MGPHPLETPVVMLVFNRPDMTARVLAEVAKQRPKTLFVCGDGPRVDRPNEASQVAATRALFENLDWDCDLRTRFSMENHGCKLGVAEGLNWVFGQTEQAIILEDDCLPDPTFFPFCEQLLKRYADDQRVMAISGNNWQDGQSRSPDSYYFSKYMHCWGWATWRRAWQKCDLSLSRWPSFRDSGGPELMADSPAEADYWRYIFERQFGGEIDSWAFAYQFTCWAEHGLTALPATNLVSNIGFGEAGTHTKNADHPHANQPTVPIHEITHPASVYRHREADRYSFGRCYYQDKLTRKLRRAARQLFSNNLLAPSRAA
ncbi:MAG: glycosyltransferase family 2 protein [Lacipirellulaceae bacterium]